MVNEDIRKEIKDAKLRLWQVADFIKIRDTEFSKKLRKELSEKDKFIIREAIKSLQS